MSHAVGLVPHLVHEAIIGRDFPTFWELWDRPDPIAVPESVAEPELLATSDIVGSGGSSRGSPSFPFSVMAGELEEPEEVPTTSRAGQPSADSEPTLEFSDLNVHKENVGTEQRKDPTLTRTWENVMVINDVPVEPGDRPRFPYFCSNEDLLYRVCKMNDKVVEQLVVPKPYRRVVLELAHGHLLGGHLGDEKYH